MSVRSDLMVALDVGSTKVACAIGSPQAAGGYELVGTSVVPIDQDGVTAYGDPLALAKALDQALDATGVAGELREAHIALAHPSLHSDSVQASIVLADEPIPVRQRDLARLEDVALNQVLGLDHEPLLIERLGFSGQGFKAIIDPVGLPAMRLQGHFHIISVPIAVRRVLQQAAESVGLEIVRLNHALPAVVAGLADAHLAQKRVLVVDVGGSATDMGLFQEGRLCASKTLAWGGAVLAYRLASQLQITLEQSNRWILQGTAAPEAAAVVFIQEQWEHFGAELKAFLAGHPLPDVALVSGRAGLMDGFAEWLEQHTGMQVQLARSLRTQRYGDVSRQVALTPVIGLLEQASRSRLKRAPTPTNLVHRVIDRTKAVLAEYF